MFKDKLQQTMQELNLSQAQLSNLTGIGKSSISQYLSGKNVPTEARRADIAQALGLVRNYFEDETETTVPLVKYMDVRIPRLLPEDAARIMGLAKSSVCNGLQDGTFPWGYAIRGNGDKWVYWINAKRFAEHERVTLF